MSYAPVWDNLVLFGCVLLVVLILYLLCSDDVNSPGNVDVAAAVTVVVSIVVTVLFFVL